MPVVRTDGRAGGRLVYGHVITKFSRMGSLPHFVTHGAPLRASRARAPLIYLACESIRFFRSDEGKYVCGSLACTQATQAHYMNTVVTLACERCCGTNGYLQRRVCYVNGFS